MEAVLFLMVFVGWSGSWLFLRYHHLSNHFKSAFLLSCSIAIVFTTIVLSILIYVDAYPSRSPYSPGRYYTVIAIMLLLLFSILTGVILATRRTGAPDSKASDTTIGGEPPP